MEENFVKIENLVAAKRYNEIYDFVLSIYGLTIEEIDYVKQELFKKHDV